MPFTGWFFKYIMMWPKRLGCFSSLMNNLRFWAVEIPLRTQRVKALRRSLPLPRSTRALSLIAARLIAFSTLWRRSRLWSVLSRPDVKNIGLNWPEALYTSSRRRRNLDVAPAWCQSIASIHDDWMCRTRRWWRIKRLWRLQYLNEEKSPLPKSWNVRVIWLGRLCLSVSVHWLWKEIQLVLELPRFVPESPNLCVKLSLSHDSLAPIHSWYSP